MRKTLAKKVGLARKKVAGAARSRSGGARPANRGKVARTADRGGGARPPPRKKRPPEAAPVESVPVPVPVPPSMEPSDLARPRALDIAQAGLDKKAEDVVVLDVRGLTSYADYFVLMTADSERQAGAIADAVDARLKERGATKVGVEGYETGRWILIDYGDVVAHVFNRESRGFYDLEGLWADAPRFAVQG
jgi:ribosome-associated protein